jgi:hypothetical protein
MHGLDIKLPNMTKLKIILFSIGFILSIARIIWKYIKEKQKPKYYDIILPVVFLWLTIKNMQKL